MLLPPVVVLVTATQLYYFQTFKGSIFFNRKLKNGWLLLESADSGRNGKKNEEKTHAVNHFD
jgi:hypothetical protein